jgi:hypothetical protein
MSEALECILYELQVMNKQISNMAKDVEKIKENLGKSKTSA